MYGYICPICNCYCRWELKYNWSSSPYVNYHCDNCGFNSSEGYKIITTNSSLSNGEYKSIVNYTNTTGGVYNQKYTNTTGGVYNQKKKITYI